MSFFLIACLGLGLAAALDGFGGDDADAEHVESDAIAALRLMYSDLPLPSDAGKKYKRAEFIKPYGDGATGIPEWSTARIMGDFPREHQAPIHTALIEPAFGRFLDVYHNADNAQVDHAAYECASDIMDAAAGTMRTLYWDEWDWKAVLIPALSSYIDEGGSGTTDGTVEEKGLPVLNIELKLPGDDGIAALQNDAYFQRIVGDRQGRMPRAFKDNKVFPACFLLDILSQHVMVVRGAVIAPPSVISSTLATVNMLAPRHSKEHLALARVLQGLRDGVARLKSRYAEWTLGPLAILPPPPHIGCLLPRNFSVKSVLAAGDCGAGDDDSRRFVVDIGFPLAADHLAFEATVLAGPSSAGKVAVLKFARDRYGHAAHAAAADAGYAPRLLGFERLPGGWYAVLMERLDKAHGWVMYDPSEPTQRAAVQAACQRGIWDRGLVHGDLRPANIFVALETADGASSPWRVCIIDWDWAGPVGSSTFPLSMSTEVRRAEGAKPGAAITKENDLAQLSIND